MAPVSFNPALTSDEDLEPKRIALAYSGGAGATSMISRLRRRFGCEVIAVVADIGQAADFAAITARALAAGATSCVVLDVRRAFLTEVVLPTLRAGALHGRTSPLGEAMARIIVASHQVELAEREGCDALAHGCAGPGNDFGRFELSYQALAPMLRVVAPADLMPGAVLFTAPDRDVRPGETGTAGNIWHLPPERGRAPVAMLDVPTELAISFEQGMPVAIDGHRMDPVNLMLKLNELGTAHGLGRGDGPRRRPETGGGRAIEGSPGGTVLVTAHRKLEKLTLDKPTLRLKDLLAQIYADVVYNGQWFSPLREALDAFVAKTQEPVTGDVQLRLYNGRCSTVGRQSPFGRNVDDLATKHGTGVYHQADTEGLVRLFGFDHQAAAQRERRLRDVGLEILK